MEHKQFIQRHHRTSKMHYLDPSIKVLRATLRERRFCKVHSPRQPMRSFTVTFIPVASRFEILCPFRTRNPRVVSIRAFRNCTCLISKEQWHWTQNETIHIYKIKLTIQINIKYGIMGIILQPKWTEHGKIKQNYGRTETYTVHRYWTCREQYNYKSSKKYKLPQKRTFGTVMESMERSTCRENTFPYQTNEDQQTISQKDFCTTLQIIYNHMSSYFV
jgi:hypothetical protein